jgi:hypothetical protein
MWSGLASKADPAGTRQHSHAMTDSQTSGSWLKARCVGGRTDDCKGNTPFLYGQEIRFWSSAIARARADRDVPPWTGLRTAGCHKEAPRHSLDGRADAIDAVTFPAARIAPCRRDIGEQGGFWSSPSRVTQPCRARSEEQRRLVGALTVCWIVRVVPMSLSLLQLVLSCLVATDHAACCRTD